MIYRVLAPDASRGSLSFGLQSTPPLAGQLCAPIPRGWLHHPSLHGWDPQSLSPHYLCDLLTLDLLTLPGFELQNPRDRFPAAHYPGSSLLV